ncbi:hypothetical protein LTR49_024830 [Elasticomyces elasticus]|nr:hypothetical protein LTR49_024830 [Elasticomyces elasticus]
MEHDDALRRAQDIMQHELRNEALLTQALTAAHRVELEDGHFQSFENNRRLAAFGEIVMKLVLTEDCLLRNHSGGMDLPWMLCASLDENIAALSNLQIRLLSNHSLIVIATQIGVDSCILRSERQGCLMAVPPDTQCTAVKAITGAVWRDTNGEQAITRDVIANLGVMDAL